MKKFTININLELTDIEIIVKNGRKFTDAIIKGEYELFEITVSELDQNRIKKYAIKNGNDNNSNRGSWYAHCNGYSMDLFINYAGRISINTYAEFRKSNKA